MKVRGKPNIQAFLDGGNSDVAVASEASHVQGPRGIRRIKKLFELPEELVMDLEQRCLDERRRTGRKVTQAEIVERALNIFIYKLDQA